jgi:hypothetical protein
MATRDEGSGKIRIEEFLADEHEPALVGTVERVEGDSSAVEITPWTPGGGCQCERSLKVPKETIDFVKPTGQTHLCCGRLHRVVEIHFKKSATIGVEDLLKHIATTSSSHGATGHFSPHVGSMSSSFLTPPWQAGPHIGAPVNCFPFAQCGSSCYDPTRQCCCCRPGGGDCRVVDNSQHQSCYYVCGGP